MTEETKQEEKKTWLNDVFEIFIGNHMIYSPPVLKLRRNFALTEALKLEKHIVKIIESIECKAYLNKKKEIIAAFNAEQAKIEDPKIRKPTTVDNMPELLELINMESGFSLDKYEIDTNNFLPDLSNILMRKIEAEKAKKKPDINLIAKYEEQLLQERERLLTSEDFMILDQFFEFK